MFRYVSTSIIVLTVCASAQLAAPAPADLPSLARSLPELVHSKQFDAGPFSQAFDTAAEKDPAAVPFAIPALAADLRDSDAQVRFEALVLMNTVMDKGNLRLFAPGFADMANIIKNGDPSSRAAALMFVARVGPDAPDVLAAAVESLLAADVSPRATTSAAETLLSVRGKEDRDQEEIIAVLNKPGQSPDVVCFVLSNPVLLLSGPTMISYVVDTANHATDRKIRDAAIAGSQRIGVAALDRIRERLVAIRNDPSESLSSHRLVHDALQTLAEERS